ncbi:MAG: LPS assembly lipoprotein LptE [Pseudomonadota bacterium]
MSWFERASTLAILLALTGCGFQLARPAPLPNFVESLNLQAEDTRSDLYLALEREFLQRGIPLQADSGNRLVINSVQSGQRILSVSARNIPREYEVFYTVNYQFFRDEELLIDRPSDTLTRDYVWNEFEVLGKVREEEQVREVIVQDLVDSIMRQLSSLQ